MRKEFINTLKNINFDMKGLERLVTALKPTGVPIPEKTANLPEDGKKIRQKARFQVTMRSAALILKKKLAGSVAGIKKEAQNMKITIPGHVLAKLNALEQNRPANCDDE